LDLFTRITSLVTLCTGGVHHGEKYPAGCDVSWWDLSLCSLHLYSWLSLVAPLSARFNQLSVFAVFIQRTAGKAIMWNCQYWTKQTCWD